MYRYCPLILTVVLVFNLVLPPEHSVFQSGTPPKPPSLFFPSSNSASTCIPDAERSLTWPPLSKGSLLTKAASGLQGKAQRTLSSLPLRKDVSPGKLRCSCNATPYLLKSRLQFAVSLDVSIAFSAFHC